MKKIITLLLISTLALYSCSDSEQQSTEASSEVPTPNAFGATVTQDGSITYDELLGQLGTQDSLATKVTGIVSEVCQAKGCWMTIASDQSDKVMRVKFTDYAFFVPTDISGRKVVFEGKAYKEETSIDELRHYAEDAGKSEAEIAAIVAPEQAYKFMADGVLLLD